MWHVDKFLIKILFIVNVVNKIAVLSLSIRSNESISYWNFDFQINGKLETALTEKMLYFKIFKDH